MNDVSERFAYRPILEELTHDVSEQGADPYEAYAMLYERRQEAGLLATSYLSTSLTSGGHARDESLSGDIGEVIARNTKSASDLAGQLALDRQIVPEGSVEPGYFGKIGHWTQTNYMEFWLCTVPWIELTTGQLVRDIDALRSGAYERMEEYAVDLEAMSGGATAEERAPEYFRMSNAFASLALDRDTNPVDNVVRMIDTDTSLGAQSERVFARKIGVPVMNISVVRPVSHKNLYLANRRLAEDTDRLISFGATIFDTSSSEVSLMLREEEAFAA